mmetsp:Transcript_4050/g.15628  ORF Transcript_4050/g.15628 Transcript_4050/m.15628 type:complete len:213 (+) Transcript_4050:661-1299(+)|eukprot:scaffold48_cov311-Pinguiococcus_pyrenoidosus.AAC.339
MAHHEVKRRLIDAVGNEHVRKCFAGLYEHVVHGPDRFLVLLDDTVHVAASLLDVPPQPPDEADVRRRIHEDAKIQQLAEPGIREEQDALHDHHGLRRAADPIERAGVRGEVVRGHRHGLAGAQLHEMLHQQVCLQRVRVVKVLVAALRHRQGAQVLVVGVVRDVQHRLGAQARHDGLCEGGLATAGAPGNAHNEWPLGAVVQQLHAGPAAVA